MDSLFRVLRRALWLCVCVGLHGAAVAQNIPATATPGGQQCLVASPYTCGDPVSITIATRRPSAQQAGYADVTIGTCNPVTSGAQWNCFYNLVTNSGGVYGNAGAIVFAAKPSYTCPSGYTLVPGSDPPMCAPNQSASCPSGKQGVYNFTTGYVRRPASQISDADLLSGKYEVSTPRLPFNTTSCVNGCTVSVGSASQATQGWVGEDPTPAGLYRVSIDVVSTLSGATCTDAPTVDTASPAAVPPPCDGYSGIVNGVPTCVPPAAGAAAASAPPAAGRNLTGNPTAGSDGSASIGQRTPSSGTGSPAGGPPSSLDGSPIGSGGAAPAPSTGASGGGSSATGTDGKNADGGACEKNPSASGCGGSPAAQPTLYTAKTRTMADAINGFKATVSASPLGTSVGGFFTVAGGGSCPTWSGQVPYLNTTITIDQFCSTMGQRMLAFMKVALMVVAGFMAFRIAVDH